MRIGFVVDGESEVASIPKLFDSLAAATQHQFLRPVLARVTPTAPVPSIAQVITLGMERLIEQGAESVLILLDREQRPECSGQIAMSLQTELQRRRPLKFAIAVVIQDRTFENWLVAAVSSIERQPKRFPHGVAAKSRIVPNKADQVDALAILKQCVKRGAHYEKVLDSQRILTSADIAEMAANSRSFRRFLRCLSHPDYADQSRRPNPRQ